MMTTAILIWIAGALGFLAGFLTCALLALRGD